jgi:Uma2 family endonuclease
MGVGYNSGMSVPTTNLDVEYPESDGKPIGETQWHIHWIMRLHDLLKQRYRNRRVLVASDLFVYYQEGVPFRNFAADAMVVLDCDPSPRRTFKIWEEGRVPNTVFELVSPGSRTEDLKFKPRLYEQLGIKEYFLYDPLAEVMRPPLQGYRLMPDGYEPLRPDNAGRLHSIELGLWLRVEDGDLVLYDAETGEKLLTEAEAEHKAFEEQRVALERERAALKEHREALERERLTRQAVEAELKALRDELRRRGMAE